MLSYFQPFKPSCFPISTTRHTFLPAIPTKSHPATCSYASTSPLHRTPLSTLVLTLTLSSSPLPHPTPSSSHLIRHDHEVAVSE